MEKDFEVYLNKAKAFASCYPEEIREDVARILIKGMMHVDDLYASGWKPKWPEKLATIYFVYKDELNSITYNVFGIGDLDQAMIYDVKNYLLPDFEAMGAVNIHADGFMD